ncbi:MAG: phosphoribosylanthranilate isomerase [Myxococcota bacterium]
MTHVKICCITSLYEANLAIRYGAHALGFVSWMPTGAGVITDERIRELAATIPAGVRRFLLTCKQEPSELIEQVRAAGTDTLQLVDRMTVPDLVRLRDGLPGVDLVQVVHVTGPAAIAEAEAVAPHVDFILLDSGRPDALVRELGGTGRSHDWFTSAEIVRRVAVPVFLAGGLGPDNVARAIREVRPYGVDVCSRLRPQRRLDEALLADFFASVQRAAN